MTITTRATAALQACGKCRGNIPSTRVERQTLNPTRGIIESGSTIFACSSEAQLFCNDQKYSSNVQIMIAWIYRVNKVILCLPPIDLLGGISCRVIAQRIAERLIIAQKISFSFHMVSLRRQTLEV